MNRELQSIKKSEVLLKIAALVAAFFAAVFCCACIPRTPENVYEPNTQFPPEYVGLINQKRVYLTSIGQAVEIIKLLRNMDSVGGINYVDSSLLKAEEVEQGAVVFVVVGCSIKSLAESGLTKESEMLRARDFVQQAAAGKFTLVCWHVGGVARRGATSDTFIEYLFGNCHLALFNKEGNSDLKLSDWAIASSVPYCQFESNMAEILRKLKGGADA